MNKSAHLRRIITGIITASLLHFAASAQEEGKGIRFFHGTFTELKAQATAAGKPVFIDAYTSWCGPCKWMSKTVFTQEEVGTFYNDKFICAKFDMEKGEGPELAKKYNVNAYPTLLYIDATGALFHQALGAHEAKDFIELGRKALDPENNMAGLQKKYRAHPSSFEAAYPYISYLSESGNPAAGAEVEQWFQAQPRESWTERANWRMLFDFTENPASPAFQNLIASRAEFSKRYSADSVDMKLRKTLVMHIQRAAYDGDMDAWKSDSAALSSLKIMDGERFISSSRINLAGDNQQLVLSRIMDYMRSFPTDNPDELNNYAWRMFESSEDPKQLLAAEGWAKKGLQLSKGSYMIHDTYASLLFKNKKFSQAKAEAIAAIERGKKDGEDVSGTEELLGKINTALSAKIKTPVKKPAAKKK